MLQYKKIRFSKGENTFTERRERIRFHQMKTYLAKTRFHLRDVAVVGPGLVNAERLTGGVHAQGMGSRRSRLLPPLPALDREQRSEDRSGADDGAGRSGELRPGRAHRRDRGARLHPFRGSAVAGVEWRGGEVAAARRGTKVAVVMVSGDAGRPGED